MDCTRAPVYTTAIRQVADDSSRIATLMTVSLGKRPRPPTRNRGQQRKMVIRLIAPPSRQQIRLLASTAKGTLSNVTQLTEKNMYKHGPEIKERMTRNVLIENLPSFRLKKRFFFMFSLVEKIAHKRCLMMQQRNS